MSSRPYRHDPLKTEAIAAFVEDLEKNNLISDISKSTSPWSSPVLLDQEEVGSDAATPGTAPSWRFCVDYSRVNNLTSVLGYSPPLVAEQSWSTRPRGFGSIHLGTLPQRLNGERTAL